jgi:signal transduction histidine kinase/ActR/RegA family two-component response regulator
MNFIPPQGISLDDILITEVLSHRASRPPDLAAENHALQMLARQMVDQSHTMLKSLVTIALDLCKSGTAGVSLLEVKPDDKEFFRWVALAGVLEACEQGTTPRNFSPCGTCLDRRAPQLYSCPERYFTYLQQAKPLIIEALVIPLLTASQPLGTIWIVSHDEQRRFDSEDVRVMTSLANFTAAALCNSKALQAAKIAADREQKARQEAETANRMKDEFLSVLSHEIRTPLNAMLGWSNLLRSRKFDQATTARALETIERNARAQAQLVDDLLDVSRIIRGKLVLDIRQIELIAVIRAAIETVRLAAEAKSIQIEFVYQPLASLVSGDYNRLQQVIWNLLSNAVKFTPSGGRVEVYLEQFDAEIQIRVRDTGIGIDAEFLPYVFERFRQADSATTRVHGGLGLGLAIVRHLVELHGGTVHVESHGTGQGAMFMVRLPLRSVDEETHKTEWTQQTVGDEVPRRDLLSLDGLRVLVVDDQADVQELLITILEHYGAEVIVTATAAEALQVLAYLRPNVLISDIGMPEADGYALIRQVRTLEAEQGGQIPAIALTAYAKVEDVTKALLAGFQLHIPKPVNPAELAVAVEKLAGQTGKSVSVEQLKT